MPLPPSGADRRRSVDGHVSRPGDEGAMTARDTPGIPDRLRGPALTGRRGAESITEDLPVHDGRLKESARWALSQGEQARGSG